MDFKYDFAKDDKRSGRKRIVKKILFWLLEIALVIAAAFLITKFAVEKTYMSGSSMSITLEHEDEIIINKLAYLFTDPNRYDIIVFKQSGREHGYYSIKRVIGLPGETIQIKEGHVYIDGEQLKEPMVADEIMIPGLAEEPLLLDEDEYFVLGDNRNMSEDSRFANVGNVVMENIIGKAWLRLNGFSFVNMLNKNALELESIELQKSLEAEQESDRTGETQTSTDTKEN